MLTQIARVGLRVVGISALLTGGIAAVGPTIAQAEELSVTTQTLRLPTVAEFEAARSTRELPRSARALLNGGVASPRPPAGGGGVTPTAVPTHTPTQAQTQARSPAPVVHTPTAPPLTPTTAPPVQHKAVRRIVRKIVAAVTGGKLAAVLFFARAQLGDSYLMGGAGPNVWDCSGLTMMAFQHAGINIGGHGVNVQYESARAKGFLAPFSSRRPGDLIFYGRPGGFTHVAIYSGGGKIIEAANPARPVIERPFWGSPYSEVARFIR